MLPGGGGGRGEADADRNRRRACHSSLRRPSTSSACHAAPTPARPPTSPPAGPPNRPPVTPSRRPPCRAGCLATAGRMRGALAALDSLATPTLSYPYPSLPLPVPVGVANRLPVLVDGRWAYHLCSRQDRCCAAAGGQVSCPPPVCALTCAGYTRVGLFIMRSVRAFIIVI